MNVKKSFYNLLIRLPVTKKYFYKWGGRLGIVFEMNENDSQFITPIWDRPTFIGDYKNLHLHSGCSIYRGSMLIARERIDIGKNTAVAYGVTITTSADPGPENRLFAQYGWKKAPVIIKNDCWICANAVLLPGVTVGECSVVAAGAVVTKDVPPYSFVAGVPAKVVKTLSI